MYKVVLVDDEHLILEGLTRVVPWASLQCAVAGTAANGQEGLRLIRTLLPDIVLTDIRMPNMDGLTMLAALRTEFPDMQLTVLTAYRDFDYAQRAICLGVCRYLLKPSKMDELCEAVRAMTARLNARRDGGAADETAQSGAREAGSFVVDLALRYMREHCAEHISLNDVADSVYVSHWHLSKLINRETGQSFFDLLGAMRVELAKRLLANPAQSVGDVALASGFLDAAHFSKSFKKMTGQTPGRYRAGLGGEKAP